MCVWCRLILSPGCNLFRNPKSISITTGKFETSFISMHSTSGVVFKNYLTFLVNTILFNYKLLTHIYPISICIVNIYASKGKINIRSIQIPVLFNSRCWQMSFEMTSDSLGILIRDTFHTVHIFLSIYLSFFLSISVYSLSHPSGSDYFLSFQSFPSSLFLFTLSSSIATLVHSSLLSYFHYTVHQWQAKFASLSLGLNGRRNSACLGGMRENPPLQAIPSWRFFNFMQMRTTREPISSACVWFGSLHCSQHRHIYNWQGKGSWGINK